MTDEYDPKEIITDREATIAVYGPELQRAATFLKSGLSVLVVCDKALVEHVWSEILALAGMNASTPQADWDTAQPDYPYPYLRALRHTLDGGSRPASDVTVLPHLDIIVDRTGLVPSGAAGELLEILYTRPDTLLLGFADRRMPLPGVVSDRFGATVELSGIPRFVGGPDGQDVEVSSVLLAPHEAARFAYLDPRRFHWHVSGLNPVAARQAIRSAMLEFQGYEDAHADDLYRALRNFKVMRTQSGSVPSVSFDDVAGYNDVKGELQAIVRVLSEGFEGQGLSNALRRALSPRALLFYGPPGTGKSLFARATANALNAVIIEVNGASVLRRDDWESEQAVAAAFVEARNAAPAVLFFDEIDAVVSRRIGATRDEADGDEAPDNPLARRIAMEIDALPQGVPILVIGSTNRLDTVDGRLLIPSRFRAVYLPLPDAQSRLEMVKLFAGRFALEAVRDLASELIVATEGFSGGEIRSIFLEAASRAAIDGRDIDARLIGEEVGRSAKRRRSRWSSG